MTIKTLAKKVLDELNPDNGELTVTIKEEGDLDLCFGISVKTVFGGKYLMVGICGGGFLKTVYWDDYDGYGSDDKVAVEDVTELLSRIFNGWYGNRFYEIRKCYYEY